MTDPQPPEGKVAAVLGLISALAGVVFFGIMLYAVIVIFF
jgi:hypothetical protein